MSILNSILNSLLNRGQVHDYAHASSIFRSNNFALAPKLKYLFQVNFVLGTEAPSQTNNREISYLVKSVDLPRYTIDVKDMNQYNRHTYIQDRIKYEPINIKFHDDNQNELRQLWQDYYNYYYADGTYDLNTYNNDDRYKRRNFSAWGLDHGSTAPFFSAIEIYSLNRGDSNKITLMSPVITSFNHDTHDYAEGQGLMEATMQIRYNGVVYEDGYANGTPGFAENGFYDPNRSDISGQYVNGYIDPTTGFLVQQPSEFTNRYSTYQPHGSFGFADQGQSLNQSAQGGFTPQEIAAIQQNNQKIQFPSNVPLPPTFTQNLPDSNPPGAGASSNGDISISSTQLGTTYADGSTGQLLSQRGYNNDQINAAINFVGGLSQDQLTAAAVANNVQTESSTKFLLAQQFIDNPTTTDYGTINYGQVTPLPTFSFTNPASPITPIYNSQTWQQILISEGVPQSQVTIAESHINQINYPPNTDLTNIARNYIAYSNSVNTPVV
jgi:hypothetical protein